MSTIKTHAIRTVHHLKETWDEMNYVQRRALEIRLGIPLDGPPLVDSRGTRADSPEALSDEGARR